MRGYRDPKPPKQLSAEARRWWRKFNSEFALDDPALLVLESGLESFDRMREAQEILRRDGLVVYDRFQQPRQHPASIVERDAKTAMLRAIKSLGLDLEPLNDGPGRPSGR